MVHAPCPQSPEYWSAFTGHIVVGSCGVVSCQDHIGGLTPILEPNTRNNDSATCPLLLESFGVYYPSHGDTTNRVQKHANDYANRCGLGKPIKGREKAPPTPPGRYRRADWDRAARVINAPLIWAPGRQSPFVSPFCAPYVDCGGLAVDSR